MSAKSAWNTSIIIKGVQIMRLQNFRSQKIIRLKTLKYRRQKPVGANLQFSSRNFCNLIIWTPFTMLVYRACSWDGHYWSASTMTTCIRSWLMTQLFCTGFCSVASIFATNYLPQPCEHPLTVFSCWFTTETSFVRPSTLAVSLKTWVSLWVQLLLRRNSPFKIIIL